MAIRIKSISRRFRGLAPGDEIVSIGGRDINDQLDLLFLSADEGTSKFLIRKKGGGDISLDLDLAAFSNAGLVFEEMIFNPCNSKCIFCFVDQMPPSLRESLYLKDDDYRFSFLYGNYVTLNNLRVKDLERIIEYNLSPLFVSVHATDERTRERLFGRKMRTGIMELLEKLSQSGITMHAQIVLVPGINDGEVLERTVEDLFGLYPECLSVAVVPVGLTKHRGGLEPVRRVNALEARSLIDWSDRKGEDFSRRSGGDRFLRMADEFYLLARRVFPSEGYYGNFDQMANGVGMSRKFIEETASLLRAMKGKDSIRMNITLASGRLGGAVIRKYIVPIVQKAIPGLGIDVLTVPNGLFGDMVGVSGLISGKDLIAAVRKRRKLHGCLILPPNCVNHSGLMIDDMKPADIGRELGIEVLVPESHFLEKDILKSCGGGRAR